MKSKFYDKKTNDEDRMKFVEYWAEYCRTHPDKEWSEQQNVLINSVIKGKKYNKK